MPSVSRSEHSHEWFAQEDITDSISRNEKINNKINTLSSFALSNMTDSYHESLPSSLLVCSCEAAEINREMHTIRSNATEILDATYQEINAHEVQLADHLKEIKDLEEELRSLEREETKILSRIHDKEQITCGDKHNGDEDKMQMKIRSNGELTSELKRRDAKIRELENELLQNTICFRSNTETHGDQ
jgi:predicted RNase H-like nuclease (RuvC/YqgF family)